MTTNYKNKYMALFNELKNKEVQDDQHLNSRVLIIDGLNTFIRAYAASPVTNQDGIHVGGISGTLMSIGSAIKSINPTRVIVIFDGKDGSAKRRQIYSEYKANRKVKIRLNRAEPEDAEDNQMLQLLRLVEYLGVLPVTTLVADGTEADDIIAYIAYDYLRVNGGHTYIMSSDKDFYQLVSEDIHVWSPTKKKLYYIEDIKEEFEIHPQNFALYRALIGDKSDNINGVDGVGDKTIKKRFPILTEDRLVTIEDLLEFAKAQSSKIKIYQSLIEQEDIIRRNIQLMQLSESNINTTNKLNIISRLGEKVNKTSKMAFYKMLTEDKMTTAIRNVDMWVKEVTTKLDIFALQSQ